MSQSRPIRITIEKTSTGTVRERNCLLNGDRPLYRCEVKNFQTSLRLTYSKVKRLATAVALANGTRTSNLQTCIGQF